MKIFVLGLFCFSGVAFASQEKDGNSLDNIGQNSKLCEQAITIEKLNLLDINDVESKGITLTATSDSHRQQRILETKKSSSPRDDNILDKLSLQILKPVNDSLKKFLQEDAKFISETEKILEMLMVNGTGMKNELKGTFVALCQNRISAGIDEIWSKNFQLRMRIPSVKEKDQLKAMMHKDIVDDLWDAFTEQLKLDNKVVIVQSSKPQVEETFINRTVPNYPVQIAYNPGRPFKRIIYLRLTNILRQRILTMVTDFLHEDPHFSKELREILSQYISNDSITLPIAKDNFCQCVKKGIDQGMTKVYDVMMYLLDRYMNIEDKPVLHAEVYEALIYDFWKNSFKQFMMLVHSSNLQASSSPDALAIPNTIKDRLSLLLSIASMGKVVLFINSCEEPQIASAIISESVRAVNRMFAISLNAFPSIHSLSPSEQQLELLKQEIAGRVALHCHREILGYEIGF